MKRSAWNNRFRKQEPTQGEKLLLVLSGLGDVILALIGGTQSKLWVSLVMLLAACGIQILVIMKVQPFRARKWNVLLGFAVVAVLIVLWWGARPELPAIVNQEIPNAQSRTTTTQAQDDDLRAALRADGNRAIRLVTVRVNLKRKYSIEEIGHFRLMYEVARITDRTTPEFYLASQGLL
jgi:hypothetical protein